MSKLKEIKLALQRMLMQFGQVSTDKGLIYWQSEGELPEIGEQIFKIDEEGNEIVPEDGEYKLDNGNIIVIADGKVADIILSIEEPAEEPVEEPVEEQIENDGDGEPADGGEDGNEPAEEPSDEPAEEPAEPEDNPAEGEIIDEKDRRIKELEDKIKELEEEVARLEEENGALKEKIEELESKPAAEPASEAFKKVNKIEKTGNAKLDKLNRILNSEF